jgi:hypothetical protein
MLAMIGTIAIAQAQGAGENAAQDGGNPNTGTGVATGRGPLSQPVPPAVSTTNPRQNLQQGPQRPQNSGGPALTNPSQQPFGSGPVKR